MSDIRNQVKRRYAKAALAVLQGQGSASIEPTRRYSFADLEGTAADREAIDKLSPEERALLDGRVMSGFIRATKP